MHRPVARTRLRRCRIPAQAQKLRRAELRALLEGVERGDLDALVLSGPEGSRVYTLQGPDAPYRALVEAMNEGAVTLLPDSTVLYCNSRFASMVALPLEQVIGAPFSRLMDAADRPRFAAMLAESVAGARVWVCGLLRGDGDVITARLSLRGLPDASPAVISMVVTDLTEHEQVNARLQAALAEKEVLLSEIHHRVKNNLQVIASLLRMQARTCPDGPWREQLRESQLRIRAMALVHEQLYATPDMARIDAASYLHALASGVMRAYIASTATISLICAVDEAVDLSINVAVPLGLIVTELVSNSVKHAFPEGQSGHIQIDLRQSPDTLALTVRDNGVGLPASLDLPSATSLGLRIVRGLAQQLKGHLHIDHAEGTAFQIVLPAERSE